MTILSIVVLMAMLWKLLTRYTGSEFFSSLNRLTPSLALARGCTLVLIPLYAAQLGLVILQSRLENVGPALGWMATLPIPVFDDRTGSAVPDAWFGTLDIALGVAQTSALAIVALAFRQRATSPNRRLVVAAGCALAALSIVAPAMATTDPYQFVATGIIGFHSYAPAHEAFYGTLYENYEKYIHMRPVVYGPLWVALDSAQTHFGSSVYEKIEALRLTNLVFFGGLLWLLALARVPRAVIVACALNPTIWLFTVADPHAEIQGLVLLAAAYACARHTKTLPACAFVMLAGLIKIQFVLIGGALLAPLPSRAHRCYGWLAAIGLVAIVSYLLPGHAYVANLTHDARFGNKTDWSTAWLVLATLALSATAVSIAFRRSFFGVALLFHQLAPLAAPWYLLWGFPYALASDRLALYVVALPVAAPLATLWGRPATIVVFVIILGLALDIARTRRVQWAAANHVPG